VASRLVRLSFFLSFEEGALQNGVLSKIPPVSARLDHGGTYTCPNFTLCPLSSHGFLFFFFLSPPSFPCYAGGWIPDFREKKLVLLLASENSRLPPFPHDFSLPPSSIIGVRRTGGVKMPVPWTTFTPPFPLELGTFFFFFFLFFFPSWWQ